MYRYVRTDPEERVFPTDKPFLVSAVNDVTKATGYYRVTPTARRARAGREAGQGQGREAPAPAAARCGLRRAARSS